MKKILAVLKGILFSVMIIFGTMLFMLGDYNESTIISDKPIVSIIIGIALIFFGTSFVCLITYQESEDKYHSTEYPNNIN